MTVQVDGFYSRSLTVRAGVRPRVVLAMDVAVL